jgi:hypothetical protein
VSTIKKEKTSLRDIPRRTAIILILFAVLTQQGCGSLSQNQFKSVEKFASACDTFSRYPSGLFTGISNLRKERGIYFAASLSVPEIQVRELNSLSEASLKERKLSRKMDVSLDVLRRYSSVLKSLSAPVRGSVYRSEFRSMGKAMDSLIVVYNSLGWTKSLPAGVISLAGKAIGYGTGLVISSSNSKILKEFVFQGDTLVSLLCGNLNELISEYVKVIIDNEKEGLKANFLSYVKSRDYIETDELRNYMDLLFMADSLSTMRNRITSAVRSLRKTHKKMADDLLKKKKFNEFYYDLSEFIEEVDKLKKAASKYD